MQVKGFDYKIVDANDETIVYEHKVLPRKSNEPYKSLATKLGFDIRTEQKGFGFYVYTDRKTNKKLIVEHCMFEQVENTLF